MLNILCRNAPADRSEALRDGPVMRGSSPPDRDRYRRPERSRSRERRRRSRSRDRDGRRRRSRERAPGAGEREIKKELTDEANVDAPAAGL